MLNKTAMMLATLLGLIAIAALALPNLSAYTYPPSGVFPSPAGISGLNYTPIEQPFTVPLFEIYKQVVYDSQSNLTLNGQSYTASGGEFTGTYIGNLYGYQQLSYIFTDRLGNTVFVPVSVDIANTITINLNVQTQADPANSNKTTITISGLVGTYSTLGTLFAPLSNNDIYLYYDTNLDFVNYNPNTDPTDAIYCAYSTIPPGQTQPLTNCATYDPVYPSRQVSYTNLVTYAPSYNSIYGGKTPDCSPPPTSLLGAGKTACNEYNDFSMSNICPNTGAIENCELYEQATDPAGYTRLMACMANNGYAYCEPYVPAFQSCISNYDSAPHGSEQFCMPVYLNGTGECTSQLGLVAKVTTDPYGNIPQTRITACGNRQDSITAVYYGYPGPEPIVVKTVPLGLVANVVNTPLSSPSLYETVNELNFTEAPATQQSAPFQIGLFLLGYGDFGILAILISILSALFLLVRADIRSRIRKR